MAAKHYIVLTRFSYSEPGHPSSWIIPFETDCAPDDLPHAYRSWMKTQIAHESVNERHYGHKQIIWAFEGTGIPVHALNAAIKGAYADFDAEEERAEAERAEIAAADEQAEAERAIVVNQTQIQQWILDHLALVRAAELKPDGRMKQDLAIAQAEGIFARISEKSADDCPYKQDENLKAAWLRGYESFDPEVLE